MLVIDASMALAWAFERQQPEDGQRASRLLSDCGSESWWVPALWQLEVANALLVAERRGVIASSASDLFRARLQALPIETDEPPPAGDRAENPGDRPGAGSVQLGTPEKARSTAAQLVSVIESR